MVQLLTELNKRKGLVSYSTRHVGYVVEWDIFMAVPIAPQKERSAVPVRKKVILHNGTGVKHSRETL